MPISKNRENKRKTTRGVMEKLVKRLKTGCFYSRKGKKLSKCENTCRPFPMPLSPYSRDARFAVPKNEN
jgi:hypothetical protein